MSGRSTDSRRFRIHCSRVAMGASALGGVFATEMCVYIEYATMRPLLSFAADMMWQTLDPPINMTLDPCPILVSLISCASSLRIAVVYTWWDPTCWLWCVVYGYLLWQSTSWTVARPLWVAGISALNQTLSLHQRLLGWAQCQASWCPILLQMKSWYIVVRKDGANPLSLVEHGLLCMRSCMTTKLQIPFPLLLECLFVSLSSTATSRQHAKASSLLCHLHARPSLNTGLQSNRYKRQTRRRHGRFRCSSKAIGPNEWPFW